MDAQLAGYRTLLGLYRPDTQSFTCPGHTAVSLNHRCGVTISVARRHEVDDLLRRVLPASAMDLGDLLADIARLVLCRHHQNQAQEISFPWIHLVATHRYSENFPADDAQSDVEERLPKPPASTTPAITNIEPEPENCGICQVELTEPVRTPCGHLYCLNCLRPWYGRRTYIKSCPMCRSLVDWDELVSV